MKDHDKDPVDEGTLTEGIATVDVDNDGLDDRLYKGPSTTTSVQDVLNRIDQLCIENLPEDLIFRMLDNMRLERDELIETAREKEKKVHAELLKGKYHIVAKTRKELRNLKRNKTLC